MGTGAVPHKQEKDKRQKADFIKGFKTATTKRGKKGNEFRFYFNTSEV